MEDGLGDRSDEYDPSGELWFSLDLGTCTKHPIEVKVVDFTILGAWRKRFTKEMHRM